MTTMLEKMARALAVEWYCETGHDDAVAVAAAETQWKAFESLARAALQAIRVPDEKMFSAADALSDGCSVFNPCPDAAFTAMIDAILNEKD